MATKKKSTAKKKTTSSRSSRKPTKAEQQSRKQLTAVVLFAVGILLLCLAAIPGKNFWNAMYGTLRGIMSWGAFLVGPIVIYTAVMIALDKSSFSLSGKVISSVLLVLLLSAAIQVFSKQSPEGTLLSVIRELYEQGSLLKGGGALGILGVWLVGALGLTGARIVVLLLVFIFIMIISGGTLIGVFRGAVKPVKKLEEAYISASEARSQQQEEPKYIPKPSFNIDVPLGDEKPALRPSATAVKEPEVLTHQLSPEARAAREKLLGETLQTAAAHGRAYDYDSDPDKPAKPTAAKPATPPEQPEDKGPTLDDLINKAVSGSSMMGGPAIRTGDGKLGFGQETPAQPAQPVQPGEPAAYSYPPLNLLDEPESADSGDTTAELKANADLLVDTLKSFGVQTRVVNISRGPSVTRYELQPSAGVKISRITNLADDIALNLAAAGVRIEAPIPNKAAIGIEVPNKKVSMVRIKEIIDSNTFAKAKSKLTVALGKDISGSQVVCDIAEMPHLLIAGTTGSGKSVCVNTLIVSLLYKCDPDELKLIMIDPKVVELSGYNGIPHLLVPVVTEPKKAAGALCSAVGEMLRRYKLFADAGVRDIKSYNDAARDNGELPKMPHMVIIVDELADLMMSAPKDVEDYICRLAQMGRAAGLHLVVATQRPSVDVITGLIKANIRSRISFAVASQVDSRTVLDMGGAEKLLGKGDMLYFPIGAAKPVRVQGCFVTDREVERVISYIKEGAAGGYDEEFMNEIDRQASMVKGKGAGGGYSPADEGGDDTDELLSAAIECVVEAGLASTSLLQRRLKVGYARAARLVDEMEQRGIVGPFEGSKPRQVLISCDRYYEMKLNNDLG